MAENFNASSAISKRRRVLLSGVILFHFLAVALPPLAFQTTTVDGPSPLIDFLIRPFRGYGEFFHLNRGYAFFAPDPGPSHLIQAAIVQPDGTVQEQMFPNLDVQWPRLLYHRHFMLSEFLNENYWPPGPPDEMFQTDRMAAEYWQQRRGRYEFIRQSMVDHLKAVNDGRDVAIRRIEHGLPALADYLAEPIELTDERLYNLMLDQPLFSDQIAPAVGNPDANIETEVIPVPQNQPSGETDPEASPSPVLQQSGSHNPNSERPETPSARPQGAPQ
ncbi:hypothetical protein [Roseiconus lacunae]|uniref:hypothetical protein n=1 Tax=Roseiconus lacunae TaxID=2605694 RepID=UPI0011F2C7CD|nr:hypothetical protein [Roseiconus lacunae]